MMDVISDPSVRRVTAMMGAQTGKTDSLINNTIGYFISQDPKSVMVMHPTQSDLTTWIEAKLNPLLIETPVVRDRVAKPRSREGVNNQKMKSYPGGFLMFAWSGSPNTMRGRSAPIILCDEVDGYEYSNEGDPVNLLWQRAATFGDQRKLIETSTPTVKNASRIEKSYEHSDKRRFWLPCPHCSHKQVLKWSQVQWDKGPDGEHLPETAHYVCEHCGVGLDHGNKLWMLQHGEWIAERPFRGHAGFHLSELYSPWRKWSDIVESFFEKKASGDLQSFVNVSLAETWEEEGEKVEHNSLYLRRESYQVVPDKACVLVAGVDVQDDRIEGEVIAYGPEYESWGVENFVLHGDPGRPVLWQQLQQRLEKQYPHESGQNLSITAACIDSGGHYTQQVYEFCKKNQHRRVWAVKGASTAGKPIASRPNANNKGKVALFTVGTDTAKELIYSRLKIAEPGAGFCHFPQTYDEEYFQQLTAETRVTRYRNGFAIKEWKKTRPRNEALDCRVYALAALVILNPVFEKLATNLEPKQVQKPAEQPTPMAQKVNNHRKQIARKQRPRGFVNSWR